MVSHVGTLDIHVQGRSTGFTFPEMKPVELCRASEVALLKEEQNVRKLVLAQTLVFFFFFSLLSLKTNKQRNFALESPFALMKYE